MGKRPSEGGHLAGLNSWKEPSTVVAIASACFSLFSLVIATISLMMSCSTSSAQKQTTDEQAVQLLSARSEGLQTHFKAVGIDDVPKLTEFLYVLGRNRNSNTIPLDFYETQIREFCPITRQAKDKLRISWVDDQGFQKKYRELAPWFLTMLAKLVGTSPNDRGDCL